MKSLITYIQEKLVIGENTKSKKIYPKSFHELREIISDRNKDYTKPLNLSDIDVSNVDHFSDLSGFSIFGGCNVETEYIDVTGWDVSHIHDMFELFAYMSNLKEIKGINDWKLNNDINLYNAFKEVPDDVIPRWYNRNKWE